jgi:hypothetical protein
MVDAAALKIVVSLAQNKAGLSKAKKGFLYQVSTRNSPVS